MIKANQLLTIHQREKFGLKKRSPTPETWFFLAVHDLFIAITANPKPGVAGPLHRFTTNCAALIDAGIVVPESENSFQNRLTAALARRTGKISILPKIVFPGKWPLRRDTVSPLDLFRETYAPLDITLASRELLPRSPDWVEERNLARAMIRQGELRPDDLPATMPIHKAATGLCRRLKLQLLAKDDRGRAHKHSVDGGAP